MEANRRVPAASYSNQAFEPEVSIISSPPVYALGGGCALYTRNIQYDMDDDGISLHPTPYYKNWKGKNIKVHGKTMSQPGTCSCTPRAIFPIVFLVIAVTALGLGLGLGLGLASK